MNITLKAILARFNGDTKKAIAYCNRVTNGTTNPVLKIEYAELSQQIFTMAREKTEAAHV